MEAADDDDHDPTLGGELTPSTASLASNIEDYQFENGRRYHAYRSGQYMYPNDETEADREDLKHHATRLLLEGRLCATTFDKAPWKVLDVGTGTGIWAMQFADDYPETPVIGIDLSPIQPKWVPVNLEFQVDDIEQEWTFNDGEFDFIHIRYMASGIRNWPQLLQRCKKALRPGGKIELAEFDLSYTSDDGTVTAENHLVKFLDDICAAGEKVGCDLRIAPKFEGMLTEAGFENVCNNPKKVPMGPWPKDKTLKTIGYCHREQFLQGLSGIAMGLLTRIMKWSVNEVEVYVALVRRDILDRKIHGYWKSYFVTASVKEASVSSSSQQSIVEER